MIKFGVRHRAFYIALAAGLVGGAVTLAIARDLALVVAANLLFVTYLGFTAIASRKFDAAFLRRHADEEDAPAPIILFVMLAAVATSAASLFVAMVSKGSAPLLLPLGIVSVVLGWFAIHTMWAMHYAYEYYKSAPKRPGKPKQDVVGGLEFPGEEAPDGMAFLYFSYVIGMTAQTADTSVTTNAMRRLVVSHGVFAFFFNTVIVAAAVNIVVSLAQ